MTQSRKSKLSDRVKTKAARNAKAKSNTPDVELDENDKGCVLTLRTKTIRTLDAVLETGYVDLEVFEVERFLRNKWDVVAKIAKTDWSNGRKTHEEHLEATELWQVKVWFRRKAADKRAVEMLLDDLRRAAPIGPKIKYTKPKPKAERMALEIDIMDPHFGLYCYKPAADQDWTLEACEAMIWWAVEDLLKAAETFAPFVEIVWPFGNDYLHADGLFHTTTAGTPQPEMMPWHEVYYRGMHIAIAIAERLMEVAPLRILQIPGNHDRQSSFTLGHVLWAYFHDRKHIIVDNSASPYKAWEFGANLIGLEHGHSVKPIRMAGLMANEWRHAWARTHYHEWHVGDQHRAGKSRPMVFEEQGVSVEFLTGLTPPNEWHKLKSFNFQKRGATGFVYSDRYGPTDKLQCHISKYSGLPLGARKFPTLHAAGNINKRGRKSA